MANICRSPTAQGVFQHHVEQANLTSQISVDSAGTNTYYIGKKPDQRAIMVAKNRGYALSKLRSRKISDTDFDVFDYILAMDNDIYTDLHTLCEEDKQYKIQYFLDFLPSKKVQEVPDPYYGGLNGFEYVMDLIEEASQALLKHIITKHLE